MVANPEPIDTLFDLAEVDGTKVENKYSFEPRETTSDDFQLVKIDPFHVVVLKQVRQYFPVAEEVSMAQSICDKGIMGPTVCCSLKKEDFIQYIADLSGILGENIEYDPAWDESLEDGRIVFVIAGERRLRSVKRIFEKGCGCRGEGVPCADKNFPDGKVPFLVIEDCTAEQIIAMQQAENNGQLPVAPARVAHMLIRSLKSALQSGKVKSKAEFARKVSVTIGKLQESFLFCSLPEYIQQMAQEGYINWGISLQLSQYICDCQQLIEERARQTEEAFRDQYYQEQTNLLEREIARYIHYLTDPEVIESISGVRKTLAVRLKDKRTGQIRMFGDDTNHAEGEQDGEESDAEIEDRTTQRNRFNKNFEQYSRSMLFWLRSLQVLFTEGKFDDTEYSPLQEKDNLEVFRVIIEILEVINRHLHSLAQSPGQLKSVDANQSYYSRILSRAKLSAERLLKEYYKGFGDNRSLTGWELD